MGMSMGFVTISDRNIVRVLADPPLIMKFIAPDDDEAYEVARNDSKKPSFLGRLFGGKAPAVVDDPQITTEAGELEEGDVDKAWHGLHYLLTGTEWGGEFPANFLLAGREVGTVEVGYGPARVLSSKEVKQAQEHLAALSDEDLLTRFNPEDMMAKAIYPQVWTRDPEEELEYLQHFLGELRPFLEQTAKDGMGLVIYLT